MRLLRMLLALVPGMALPPHAPVVTCHNDLLHYSLHVSLKAPHATLLSTLLSALLVLLHYSLQAHTVCCLLLAPCDFGMLSSQRITSIRTYLLLTTDYLLLTTDYLLLTTYYLLHITYYLLLTTYSLLLTTYYLLLLLATYY